MPAGKIIVWLLLVNLAVLNLFAQNCICPVLKMIEPSGSVKPGERAVFTAEVKGWKNSITYNWSVSGGTIFEGQGTPVISVDTTGLEGTNLTATVQIDGGWCPACEKTNESGVAVIEPKVRARLVDQFTRYNCEDVLARMDNLFTELKNDPTASGYLIIYGKAQPAAVAEREARNWITIRRFDASRIILARDGSKGESQSRALIEMWLVPTGAEPPEVVVAPEANVSGQVNPAPTDSVKPYIFTFQTADGIDGCKPLFDVEGYIKALQDNPKSRGNIVILEASRTAFRRTEKEILGELIKGGIARKRLNTFFKKVTPNSLAEGIELWLLP